MDREQLHGSLVDHPQHPTHQEGVGVPPFPKPWYTNAQRASKDKEAARNLWTITATKESQTRLLQKLKSKEMGVPNLEHLIRGAEKTKQSKKHRKSTGNREALDLLMRDKIKDSMAMEVEVRKKRNNFKKRIYEEYGRYSRRAQNIIQAGIKQGR